MKSSEAERLFQGEIKKQKPKDCSTEEARKWFLRGIVVGAIEARETLMELFSVPKMTDKTGEDFGLLAEKVTLDGIHTTARVFNELDRNLLQ